MPPITALLHTHNDALRLGRALETLYPCDEILIIDHHSSDGTVHIARQYGANIIPAEVRDKPSRWMESARYDWVFCLDPRESTTEGLATSLFEWKCLAPEDVIDVMAFSISVREENVNGWRNLPAPETRLVPRNWHRWQGHLPVNEPAALTLEGFLLRFDRP